MAVPLISRRESLSQLAALVGATALGIPGRSTGAITSQDLIQNGRGGYRFVPGVPFLSFGVRATDGHEIVRTTYRDPRPFLAGLEDIERFLRVAGRPLQALCGLELRTPRPFSVPEFIAFNVSYKERLRLAGLLVGDHVPVTRTNVAFTGTPAASGPPEVSIHAFSYTMPTAQPPGASVPTFVLAGMPEIRNLQRAALGQERPDIVAVNDTTPTGVPTAGALRMKTEFILTALDGTMHTLGVRWADVTAVQLYTIHNVQPLLANLILPRVGPAARLGIEWHHTSPPGAHVEVGPRGIAREVVA